MNISKKINNFLKMLKIIFDYIKNNQKKDLNLWEIYFEEQYSTLVLDKFKSMKFKTSDIQEIHYCTSNKKDTYFLKLLFVKNIEYDNKYCFMDEQSSQYFQKEILVCREINKVLDIAKKNSIRVEIDLQLCH
jgi:hypothetical protein